MDFLPLLHTIAIEVTIIFLPFGGVIPSTGTCGAQSNIAGIYQDNLGGIYQTTNGGDPTIYICTQELYGLKYQEDEIKYHELGHYIWDKKLTQQERDIYTKHYNEAKSKYGSGSAAFIREYSSTAVTEDFADTIYSVVLDYKYDRDPENRKEWILRERRMQIARLYLLRIEKRYDSQDPK